MEKYLLLHRRILFRLTIIDITYLYEKALCIQNRIDIKSDRVYMYIYIYFLMNFKITQSVKVIAVSSI